MPKESFVHNQNLVAICISAYYSMYSSLVRMGLLQTHQLRHLLLGKHFFGFLSQLNHSPAANWYTNGSGLSEDIALTVSQDVKE